MTALAPQLSLLDQQVLDALSDHGQRAGEIAATVLGESWWRCESCGRERLDDGLTSRYWLKRRIRCQECCLRHGWGHPPTMVAFRRASAEDITTVREVLRGLECVGRAQQHGGWWRRPHHQGSLLEATA